MRASSYIILAGAALVQCQVALPLPTDIWLPTLYPCWADLTNNARALGASGTVDPNQQSVSACLQSCGSLGFNMAGLEFGRECWCGNTILGYNRPISSSNCNQNCAGKSSDTCGGPNALSLYTKNAYVFTMGPPRVMSDSNGYANPQCYSDPNPGSRILPRSTRNVDYRTMTVDSCTSACRAAGLKWAGLEYGRECYCGGKAPAASALLPLKACDQSCFGDGSQNCGGSNQMLVYSSS